MLGTPLVCNSMRVYVWTWHVCIIHLLWQAKLFQQMHTHITQRGSNESYFMNISYRQHCEKHRHAHTQCTDTHTLAHIGNKHRNSKINPLFLFARSLRPQNKNDINTVAFRVSITNTHTHLFPPESRGKQVATWITRNVAMDKGQCREGRELHTRDCVEAFSMKPSFDSHRKPQKVEQCLCLGLLLYVCLKGMRTKYI